MAVSLASGCAGAFIEVCSHPGSVLLVFPLALVLLFSALVSGVLLWALLPQLRRRLLDQPNARSSHQRPTPRGGGLVFVLVAALSSASALLGPSGQFCL